MKNKFKIILCLILCSFLLFLGACTKDTKKDIAVTSVSLLGESKMFVGDKQTLTVDIYPSDATSKEVTWELEGDAVALNDGVVEAIKEGKATIYVTSTNGISDFIEITVEVKKEEVKALDITIKAQSEVTVGKQVTVKATLVPENATDSISFEALNPDLATISNDGVITALKAGVASFKVKAGDIEKEFTITVNEDVLTSDDVKEKLNKVYNDYANGTIGTALMTMDNSGDVTTFSYKYEFDGSTVIKLECIQLGKINNAVYIRNGMIYMDVNETKGKYQLEQSEYKTIMNTYSFDKYFSDGVKYRSDNSFFNALKLTSGATDKDNGTFKFTLSLKEYDGTLINLIGKDSVELIVVINKGVITSVEYKTTGVEGDKSVKLEFLGQTCVIDYPDDLDTYEDMQ